MNSILRHLLETDVTDDVEDQESARDIWTEPSPVQLIKKEHNGAHWVYMRDRTWEIWTELQSRDTLILTTPRRNPGLSHKSSVEPVRAMYDIVSGILDNIAGFKHLNFVLVPESQDDMLAALDHLEQANVLKITGRNGQALYTDIVRPRARMESEGAEDSEDVEDAKEVGFGEEPEYSLAELKQLDPEFFSRKNTKVFGTKKIYRYAGNYIVLKNVTKSSRPGYPPMVFWPIYQWRRTEHEPEGEVDWIAEADGFEDAKWMIKNKDFRSRSERRDAERRALGHHIPESEEPDDSDRDLWADASDINQLPKGTEWSDLPPLEPGTPVIIKLPSRLVNGVPATVVKCMFTHLVVRISPEAWLKAGLIGDPYESEDATDLILAPNEVEVVK